MKLEVANVVLDDSIYPRTMVDWITVARYVDALRQGAEFPPILVGKNGAHWVIVDGAHRLEAHRRAGRKKIKALLTKRPADEWFAEAVATNAKHGRVLTTQERIQSADRLIRGGWDVERAASLIAMAPETLKRLRAERVVRAMPTDGRGKARRGTARSGSAGQGEVGQSFTKKGLVAARDVSSDEQQATFSVRDQRSLFRQVLALIEHDLMDRTDEEVVELAERLTALLRELFPVDRAA